MDAKPRKFQTLVPLQVREGMVFEVDKNLSTLPNWFQAEYLQNPKAVHLEARLVEEMFGRDGEHIPHTEGVTRTLLHVNQWEPGGEAEILIFGRPSYQLDVSEMILNLAEHFRQRRERSSEKAPSQEAENKQIPDANADTLPQQLAPGDGETKSPKSTDLAQEAPDSVVGL